jgi:endonuclease III
MWSAAMSSHDEKRPFDIDLALERIEKEIRPFPKAALFELAEDGFITPFEQLVACMISIRTRDETTIPVARRLFERARTPEEMVRLSPDEIDDLIRDATFHEPKSRQIHAIAEQVLRDYGGEVPCDYDALTSFKGVGPKCANLVLGIACRSRAVGVDIHVHRVTNRWGYVQTSTPEQTTAALEDRLPHEYWIDINRLLVPFGKHVCTGRAPKCSTCPVLDMCRQVGVTSHR